MHANQISDWKKQLLESALDAFGKGARKAGHSDEAVESHQAQIGQLTVENQCGLERI